MAPPDGSTRRRPGTGQRRWPPERASDRRRRRRQALVTDGTSGALLIADIDHFKAINDDHGHPVGDEVLRAVAATLRSAVPAGADIGRLGGEEFVVVLPRTGRAPALQVAEQARRAIAALDASKWLPDRGVTISIGATAFARHDDLAAILHRADEALYQAKRGGRNCVRWSPGDDGPATEDVAPVAPDPLPHAAWQGTRP